MGKAVGRLKSALKSFLLTVLPAAAVQNIKKMHYAQKLREMDKWGERDLEIVNYLITSGDYTIDVGANIGVYTKHLSDLVGDRGRVFGFEPIPETYDILASNVARLQLRNAHVINCAVSDSNRMVTMEIPLYAAGGGENFFQARIVDESGAGALRRIRIHTKTIDSVFNRSPRISFIKVDVEGHELACVKGAEELIRTSRPALLIEVTHDPDKSATDAHELFSILDKYGYAAYFFDGERFNKRKPGDRSVNYFFLTQQHIRALEVRDFFTRYGDPRDVEPMVVVVAKGGTL